MNSGLAEMPRQKHEARQRTFASAAFLGDLAVQKSL
jgi:hypothetical protein